MIGHIKQSTTNIISKSLVLVNITFHINGDCENVD